MEVSRIAHSGEYSSQPAVLRRILVVDDDDNIRQLSIQVLANCGYDVEGAEDGDAGWEALHGGSYDLLITDQNMPKVSGIELIKRLRSAGMTIPVVLFSGSLPSEVMSQSLVLKLAAFLLKPFTSDELVATVERILQPAERVREWTQPQPVGRNQPVVKGLWP